jgi:phage tail protein X
MEAKNPDPPVPADPSGKELPGRAPYSRVGFETKKILTVPTDATLTSLAVKHYGSANPMLLDLILEMNPGITDLDVILQGQNVRLPIVTDTTAILKFPEGAYKIHIGTFMQQGKAAEYRRGLDFKGKTVEIEPRKVSGKKTWYRILAGPYPTQEECEEALARLNDTK